MRRQPDWAWILGTRCVSHLRGIAFSRRNGPGRLTPEAHEQMLRRMENTAVALATVAGHYAIQVLGPPKPVKTRRVRR